MEAQPVRGTRDWVEVWMPDLKRVVEPEYRAEEEGRRWEGW